MSEIQGKRGEIIRMLRERDGTIEKELFDRDQANSTLEERAAKELYRRRHRIDALEGALKLLIEMETNRYACASERNLSYKKAKEILEDK